jgi:DNA-binding transcriptional LysR family regulator
VNLRQLELFTEVAETGIVSHAAKKLYMSQPAVSQTIADLEDSLGLKLFDRLKHKMQLTFAGEVLYQYSKKILSLVDEAESQMLDMANLKMGRLRLGASTTIGIYMLPHLLGEFKREYETIQSTCVIDNTSVIEEMLLTNQLDIGFVEGLVHSTEIVIQKVMNDEIWLICSPQHRWAREGKLVIDPVEIAGEALILREQGSGTREVVEKKLKEHSVCYEVWHVLNNTEAIKRAVAADIGIAFISQRAVKEEIESGRLVNIKLKGLPISREFKLIWHKDKYRSPLLNAFIQFVINNAE